jgi:Leucine-rich repeat (LRR) protein
MKSPNLKILDLRSNQFEVMPAFDLPNLEELDLQWNPISQFPDSFCDQESFNESLDTWQVRYEYAASS